MRAYRSAPEHYYRHLSLDRVSNAAWGGDLFKRFCGLLGRLASEPSSNLRYFSIVSFLVY